MALFCELETRALLSLSGEDVIPFLQGVVTNDVEPLMDGRSVFAALLTPQGKYLHDFILVRSGELILLDTRKERIDDLKRRLSMYRLRAKVDIRDVTEDMAVFALLGDDAFEAASLDGDAGLACERNDGVVTIDPRLRALGLRAILPRALGAALLTDIGFTPASSKEYDAHRIAEGVAETLQAEAIYPLEAGFDELNGVSFTKGCYVGQEVTARMKTRKLVRKRILPMTIDQGSPCGSVTLQGAAVGEMIESTEGAGLALVRLEDADRILAADDALSCGESRLLATRPDWMNF